MQNCMSHLGGTFQNRMPHKKFRTCKNRDSTSSPDSEQDYLLKKGKNRQKSERRGIHVFVLRYPPSCPFLPYIPSCSPFPPIPTFTASLPPSPPSYPSSFHLLLHVLHLPISSFMFFLHLFLPFSHHQLPVFPPPIYFSLLSSPPSFSPSSQLLCHVVPPLISSFMSMYIKSI